LPWRLQGHAQAFAGKPIRVLVGVPAGGTQDMLTRAIADQVRNPFGPLTIDKLRAEFAKAVNSRELTSSCWSTACTRWATARTRGGNIHSYRRMIHHMDEDIGRIVDALQRNGRPTTRWSCSPPTTAASASPTTGRWSAAGWT
jgi:hypothetical protein